MKDQRHFESLAFFCVLAVALAVAITSARDTAGGWNDGSRLATVEALVDYHTLAIDDSIFVKLPWPSYLVGPAPYRDAPWLTEHRRGDPFPYPLRPPSAWSGDGLHPESIGTRDKVLIGGHFYSHKPPLPSFLLAAWYWALQAASGLKAHDRPDEFCYWMTLGSAGASYVITLLATFQLGRLLAVPLAWRLLLTASLGFSTVAVAYVRNVNDHILLLAVAGCLALALAHLAQWSDCRRLPLRLLSTIGALSGLAYTIDQATGPMILLATFWLAGYRLGKVAGTGAPAQRVGVPWLCSPSGRRGALAVVALAAVPWLVAHHAVNYAISGTIKSIGMVPEFFDWPGSPFDRRTMTGFWHHQSLGDFVDYLAELMILPRYGFLPHNLPLLLTITGLFAVWRRDTNPQRKQGRDGAGVAVRRVAEMPELVWGAAWCLGSWLLYGALSNNYAGDCCSTRWFVPFLAAGYYVLAVLVRDDARYRCGLLWLSGLGAALAWFMWQIGPWLEPSEQRFAELEVAGHLISPFVALEYVGLAAWLLWMVWGWWKGHPLQ